MNLRLLPENNLFMGLTGWGERKCQALLVWRCRGPNWREGQEGRTGKSRQATRGFQEGSSLRVLPFPLPSFVSHKCGNIIRAGSLEDEFPEKNCQQVAPDPHYLPGLCRQQ